VWLWEVSGRISEEVSIGIFCKEKQNLCGVAEVNV